MREHEPIMGVWGLAPSGVQGQSPWSGGQGGPLKLNVSEEYTDNFSLILIQLAVFYVNEKQLQYIKSLTSDFR